MSIAKRGLFLLISVLLFLILFLRLNNVAVALLFSAFCFILLDLFRHANKNKLMILYLCTLFVFLMGRILSVHVLGMEEKAYVPLLTDEATKSMLGILLLSILSLYIGYIVGIRKPWQLKFKFISITENEEYRNSLRRISKPLVIVLYAISIAENIVRIQFIRNVGYFESYLSRYYFPSVLSMLADITPVVSAIYLATLPSKKDIAFPSFVFCVALCTNALGGFRYKLVSGLLLIIFYCLERSEIDQVRWIKKGTVVVLCLLVPVFIVVLQYMSNWRLGQTVYRPYFQQLAEFFYSVGGSGYLIGYSHMYRDYLTARNVWFSFGRVWKFFVGNPLAKAIFNPTIYLNQTVENALYGRSFGDAITYLTRRSSFLSGYGMGSCYIAELFLDFSYFGVFVGNLFIGSIIKKVGKLSKNTAANFLLIFFVMLIFRTPRDTFDYVLIEFLGIKNIVTVIALHLIAVNSVVRKNRLITAAGECS